jgi:hypothetical protein
MIKTWPEIYELKVLIDDLSVLAKIGYHGL